MTNSSPSPPPSWQSPLPSSILWLTNLASSEEWIMQYLSFCSWFISLSVMSSRFICVSVVVYGRISFFFWRLRGVPLEMQQRGREGCSSWASVIRSGRPRYLDHVTSTTPVPDHNCLATSLPTMLIKYLISASSSFSLPHVPQCYMCTVRIKCLVWGVWIMPNPGVRTSTLSYVASVMSRLFVTLWIVAC